MFVFCMVMLYYGVTFRKAHRCISWGCSYWRAAADLLTPRKGTEIHLPPLILTCLVLLETNYYFMVIEPMEMSRDLTLHVPLADHVHRAAAERDRDQFLPDQHQRAGEAPEQTERFPERKKNELVVTKEAELAAAYTKLENYNAKLETEVRNRTTQLRKSNIALEDMLLNLRTSNSQLRDQDQQLKGYVAELESLKQDLMRARDEAEHANAAKSAFLREISHRDTQPAECHHRHQFPDVCTTGQPQQDPAQHPHMIRNIYNSSHSLLDIINNVLELARIEAGKTDRAASRTFRAP